MIRPFTSKIVYAAVAGLFLLGSLALGQKESQIASIRAEVGLINKSGPKFRRTTRTVEGISLEGTEAVYLTSNEQVRKVNARMFGETFRASAELFYKDGKLIFAFQRLEGYDTHIAADPPPKVNKVIETRVYYSDGRAIRVMEGKNQLPPSGSDFRAAELGMNDLSEKLIAAFRR